ncbi:tRNA dimethylallyltransferase [Geosmithia morbida]|uniref:tRNA dimethylallyltransferase n=1 Tax=Geosmithia morbida TaxID=1094350 RepID=A0A9P5D3M5_9HYPO|nr:tRNA dimethylallyltransferase [Geosmithia morbida]KAF4120664.1 tRNA dimethylallyltransferase [Geosmithia morbida]
MATSTRLPTEPLLVILGSTGTGKSELAIELAKRFRGEVINADAMQMYAGLPIMTNKVSESEQQGITHHLLGHIAPDSEPWDIDDFRREATAVIRGVRSRGNLPILVGGTAYYVDALLFRDTVLPQHDPVGSDDGDDGDTAAASALAILEEPTPVLHAELKKVDPTMALHWHPNDRRKIRRSLEIYLRTGRRASDIYAEQKAERETASAASAGSGSTAESPWDNLLLWVYSERDVLKDRLDVRVDKMLDSGLLDEVRQLIDLRRAQESATNGQPVDTTRGIWQSIGYKQLEPYVAALDRGHADDAELADLRTRCVDDMKTATRRYAMYQTRWTRQKKIPRLRDQGPQALDSLYVLDSTDVSRFAETAVRPAVSLTDQFLRGQTRPHPTDLSDLAREVLGHATLPRPEKTPCERMCEICGISVTSEEQWTSHMRGRMHRARSKKKKRLALIPAGVLTGGAGGASGGQDTSKVGKDSTLPEQDVEIGSMFQQ